MPGIFLDSGIYIAFANRSDRDHESAMQILNRIRVGEFGRPYTSDYVFDEAVTATLVRTGRYDIAVNLGRIILGEGEGGREGKRKEEGRVARDRSAGDRAVDVPSLARILKVEEHAFMDAWRSFRSGRYNKRLSFTDHTILAQVKELKIDSVASFDKAFDGLVQQRVS